MKRSFFLVLGMLISITVLMSCGSDSNSDKGEVIPQLTTSKSIASMAETVVKVAGEGNDLLTITIPKLPFGESEDIVVEFKLIYNGIDPLPEISIDTDIEFDAAVTLEFRSDSLTENSYVFVYHGAAQDYFVPFEKNGNIYTAKLMHFSEYGFDETPGPMALRDDIIAGLLKLNSNADAIGDGGLYALNRALIGDIVTKINLLEQMEPKLEHTFWAELIAIIDRVVVKWLDKMEGSQVTFWDGYCVHNDFKTFLTQLVQTMTEVELAGAADISARVNKELWKRMEAAAVEWETITPPGPCEISSLEKYIKCAVKFDTEMELSGADPSVKIIESIVNLLDNNNLYILQSADCDNVECLRYYLSKQSEMEYMGVTTDYTQALQAKLTEIEEMIENGSCNAGPWKFTVNYSNPDYGSGTITASNIIIDFDAEADASGTKIYAIADSTCRGDLYGCGDFLILNDTIVNPGSKWVSFDSTILIDTVNNIEGEMISGELDYGMNGLVCDGHIPAGFGPDSEATTWTYTNNFSTWTLTLEPCPSDGCD